MKTARIINAAVWLYLWLSQVMMPVVDGSDFWAEKGRQLLQFGPFDDPSRLMGRAIIPLILWFVIDRGLKKVKTSKTP
ncbi:MAG: hypothetical protein GC131_08140 [Alphaproteobacteria bacterium]|nr:hypothetical protein [Alphaproteobacteria bacterium]